MSERPRDVILELDQVNLSFELERYRSWTLREFFSGYLEKFTVLEASKTNLVHVAQSVSFNISRGERVGLIGVNGAGKTSLCRLISGMYAPDSGKIIKNGQIRAILDAAAAIYPDLTGRENLNLLSHFLFPDDSNRVAIVEEALEWSELGHFVDVPVRVYSKGMQTRLILSLISSCPCDLMILDEVFDGADQFFSSKTVPRLLNTIHQSGAVLFVSHVEEQIRNVCNRLLLLDHGKIIFDGSVELGLKKYKNLRGQSF